MSDFGFYENSVKPPHGGKRLFYKILSWVIFFAASTAWIAFSLFKNIPPALIIILFVLFAAILSVILGLLGFIYEYSVCETSVTLAKIYGKSRRKEMFEIDADNIIYAAPKNEDNLKKCLDEFKVTERFDIYSPEDEGKVWLIVFENKKQDKLLFACALEDYAVKLLKSIKPSVMSYR